MKAVLRSLRAAARRATHAVLNPIDPPTVVLLYHRVASLTDDPLGLAVRPDRFRDQMNFLASATRVVRFEALGAGSPGVPAVAVTFDDGYADNALEALPILEAAGVPACFFITSGYVGGSREFWWDELESFFLGTGPLPDTFLLPGESHALPARTAPERAALKAALQAQLRRLPPGPRESLLSAVASWGGRGRGRREAYRQLTGEEIARMAASPVATIGSHGVTHASFAALNAGERRAEFVASKAALERWTARPVTTFAFPYGERSDVPADAVSEAADAGFHVVALNQPGQVRRGVDPRRIPRFVVRDWDVPEFARRLQAFRVA